MAEATTPRRATPDDVPAIAAIERAAFSDPWSPRSLSHWIGRAEGVFLVIESGEGDIAGYAIGVGVADEGEVLNIAVDPARLRRGLGRQLLRSLVQALRRRGAGRLFLEVRASNAAAIGLYEAEGFRRLGRRPHYYEDPREDAVTMALETGQGTQENGHVPHEIG